MRIFFQVTGRAASECLSLRNAAMVSLASLSTMIGSWQFLEKDEIKEWKTTLPVQGHVRVRVGKRKTSVWGSEIFHVILLQHHPQGLVKETLH